jgi:hypothetical protein
MIEVLIFVAMLAGAAGLVYFLHKKDPNMFHDDR